MTSINKNLIKKTKLTLAKELSNYNYKTNTSRIFNIREFINEFDCLKYL